VSKLGTHKHPTTNIITTLTFSFQYNLNLTNSGNGNAINQISNPTLAAAFTHPNAVRLRHVPFPWSSNHAHGNRDGNPEARHDVQRQDV
jgi:hypothetical protein